MYIPMYLNEYILNEKISENLHRIFKGLRILWSLLRDEILSSTELQKKKKKKSYFTKDFYHFCWILNINRVRQQMHNLMLMYTRKKVFSEDLLCQTQNYVLDIKH